MSDQTRYLCPSCGEYSTFTESPTPINRNHSDKRQLIDTWGPEFQSKDHYDPERLAYRRRLRKSATALVSLQESFPARAFVCWSCLHRGDLNEMLNEIAITNIQTLAEYHKETNLTDKEPPMNSIEEVSEHELAMLTDAIRREMQMAELLDEEYRQVEGQLQSKIETNAELIKSIRAVQYTNQQVQDSLESIDVQLQELEKSIEVIPKSKYERWKSFFDLEDCIDYASIKGVPVAVLSEPKLTNSKQNTWSQIWTADSKDMQNIAAGITMLTVLIGRLTALLPKDAPAIIKREFRVESSPPQLVSRNATPIVIYSLLPYPAQDHNKPNIHWPRSLDLLAHSISSLHLHWQQLPPKDAPSANEPSLYQLDPSNPTLWNQRMRKMILMAKALITLQFPSTTGSLSISKATSIARPPPSSSSTTPTLPSAPPPSSAPDSPQQAAIPHS